MERQLELLEENPPEWRIDDSTRAVGRAGVADARQALRDALQRAGGNALQRAGGNALQRADAARRSAA